MKIETFADASIHSKCLMLDPPGKDQDEDILNLIQARKELDEKIASLLAQRKEFNDLIIKNCNHPLQKRALTRVYLTDTLGNNGYDNMRLVCRDCGETLKYGRDRDDEWNYLYFNLSTDQLDEILKNNLLKCKYDKYNKLLEKIKENNYMLLSELNNKRKLIVRIVKVINNKDYLDIYFIKEKI